MKTRFHVFLGCLFFFYAGLLNLFNIVLVWHATEQQRVSLNKILFKIIKLS